MFQTFYIKHPFADDFERKRRMRQIVPHLWFDDNGEEAIEYYFQLFENSRMVSTQLLEDTPSGDAAGFEFELAGQLFMATNGGPYFKFNPSVSFTINCKTKEDMDKKWAILMDGGMILMPLQEYPFAPYYGWVQDKFGLSWQLMLFEESDIQQKIVPHLMFSNEVTGKAREAIEFYADTFENGEVLNVYEYAEGESNNPQAEISHSTFRIWDTILQAADNGEEVDYTFNEAVSFMVLCEDQAEIDEYWEKLSAVPEAEQCGWLQDKYGVSWQIVPKKFNDLFVNGTRRQINAVTQAFLPMKKLDIAELERVWEEAK